MSRSSSGEAPRPTTVAYIACSLDGFIARPDGAIDWLSSPDPPPDDDFGWSAFLQSIDAIVMGRKTFEQVCEFDGWPYEGIPLTVLSATLTGLPEGLPREVALCSAAPAALLNQLGSAGHRRVYVDGGATIQRFLREDLIDELIITTMPLLIGRGVPLFGELDADLRWEHHSTEVLLPGGLVKSGYRRHR